MFDILNLFVIINGKGQLCQEFNFDNHANLPSKWLISYQIIFL